METHLNFQVAMVTAQSNTNESMITLMPNRSSSMRQTRILIIAVSLFVLLLGIGWGLMGASLILPFAGLDVALFAYFMHKVCLSTYEKQVITIDEKHVLFEAGKQQLEKSATLKRPDAYLSITDSKSPNEPFILNLSDSKNQFELGEFLNQDDKNKARRVLKQAGLREVKASWWKDS